MQRSRTCSRGCFLGYVEYAQKRVQSSHSETEFKEDVGFETVDLLRDPAVAEKHLNL